MVFTPQPVGKYHVLAQVNLTGKTLYYADENLSMSDGKFYEGRLSVSSLQRAFSSFTEPKQRQSTLDITLLDADKSIRQLLDDYTWGNREIVIYIGTGRDLDDYSIDFHGYVKFPGGISYDRDEVHIRLRDVRNKDVITLPVNNFWTLNYPNLQDGLEGKPIPIAYGDWTTTWVLVTCIDTTVNEFKIADHPIKSLYAVAKNGSPATPTDVDLENATFRISSYDPENDEVAAKFEGRKDSESNLLMNPAWVEKDLLTSYVGVEEANIDTDSFNELAIEVEDFRCRRIIDTEISSDTLIEELNIECMIDQIILNDKYVVKSRMPSPLFDRVFDEMQIAPKSFWVDSDPEKLFTNRIKCRCKYDPRLEEYTKFLQVDNVPSQTEMQQVVSRTIEFNWLYDLGNADVIAQHLILLYAKEIGVIKVTVLGDGILTQLADRLGVTYSNFVERPIVVREISKHYKTMSCTIFGYDEVKHVLPGYWSPEDAPNYDDATAEERATLGFWTNDDGEAHPEDPDSVVSHWW